MESCEFSNGVILSYSIVTNLHVRGSGRFIQVLVQVYCMIMLTVCMLGKSLFFNLAFDFLSVLCGHSVFSSPPMTSDFEGFSIPDVIHYIIQKEPVFPF